MDEPPRAFPFTLVVLGIILAMSCADKSAYAKTDAACPVIVSRSDWQAKPPKNRTDMATPVPFVILHHTLWDECYDFESCCAEMRKIQDFHQGNRSWDDIGYNFCVGQDGRIYEGRGWDTVGAHAPWYNLRSIGICIMGNFTVKLPNQKSVDAVSSLIKCAIEENKLKDSYILYGHRQVRATGCPGDALFKEIQSWPHWKPGQHYPPTQSKPVSQQEIIHHH